MATTLPPRGLEKNMSPSGFRSGPPELGITANFIERGDDSSDDEDSSCDIRAAVARLGNVGPTASQDPAEDAGRPQIPGKAPRKGRLSDGALDAVDAETRGWSPASNPELRSLRNSSSRSSLEKMEKDPTSTVSWRDIEQYCQELDAECSEVRIETLDLSDIKMDVSLTSLSPRMLAVLRALESSDSPAGSFVERADKPVSVGVPAAEEEGGVSAAPQDADSPRAILASDVAKAVYGLSGTTQAALEAKLKAALAAKPGSSRNGRNRRNPYDLAYTPAAARANEVAYSFTLPSPSAAAKSPSHFSSNSPSASGRRKCRLTPSSSCSANNSGNLSRSSTSTSGQNIILGVEGSPSASSQSSSSAASQGFTRESMSQAPPYQADKDKAQQQQEAQPETPQHNSRKGSADGMQRHLGADPVDMESEPARYTSMILPGATAARTSLPRPAGGKGFLGGLKAKCGEMFSSSKKK